jgi:adenylate cyclase
MNFTALGSTVNLASRLEGLNKRYGTSVLVSEAVRNAVASDFVFRCIDRIAPKGFGATVTIFELRCRRSQYTEIEAAFCERWNVLFEDITDFAPSEALLDLEGFLDAYPDDRIAQYHAAEARRSLYSTTVIAAR